MRRRWTSTVTRTAALLLGAGLLCGCGSERPRQAAPTAKEEPAASPDRLEPGESIAEGPTAFGLPLPPGMRMTRQFRDSAYFSGPLSLEQSLEHLRSHVVTRDIELRTRRALIPHTHIKGDRAQRLFRIEISRTGQGSQIYIQDITPPEVTQGLSETERWRRAGRNPDGSLLNPSQVQ